MRCGGRMKGGVRGADGGWGRQKLREQREQREKEQENLASKQDQLGLHTFRRGDKVVYKSNPKAIAFVSALSFPKTGPKYLVLQEEASSLFFIGGYSESSHS